MKKVILLCGALLALTSSLALAQGGALNMAWDGCPGTALGQPTTTFACTDFDEYLAYGSFAGPAGATNVNGMDIVLDIETAGSALPAWWDFTDTGCRSLNGSNVISMAFGRPSGCTIQRNYWVSGAGGIAAFRTFTTDNPTPAPNRARIVAAAGIADAAVSPITLNQNVFAFGLTITGEGTSACAGCNTPVSVVLNQITLGLQTGEQIRIVTPGTNACTAANGAPAGLCQATPTRNKTWGQVKSLYR